MVEGSIAIKRNQRNQAQSSAIKEYLGIARMVEGSIFADELPEPPTGVHTVT
jgi:hypothetical protein